MQQIIIIKVYSEYSVFATWINTFSRIINIILFRIITILYKFLHDWFRWIEFHKCNMLKHNRGWWAEGAHQQPDQWMAGKRRLMDGSTNGLPSHWQRDWHTGPPSSLPGSGKLWETLLTTHWEISEESIKEKHISHSPHREHQQHQIHFQSHR